MSLKRKIMKIVDPKRLRLIEEQEHLAQEAERKFNEQTQELKDLSEELQRLARKAVEPLVSNGGRA